MTSAKRIICLLLFDLVLGAACARAQDADEPEKSPSEAAEKRFPQPVLVGALLGRAVLEPLESQPVLGYVDRIVREGDGQIKVVVRYGGILGFGSRPIAVPVEAMVLLGADMEVMDFKPEQLAQFPTFDGGGVTPLATGDTINVGLARPSH